MRLEEGSPDFEALYKTVVGEAIGEVKDCQIAVAWVMMNRVRISRKEWGNTIQEVCTKLRQCECTSGPKKLSRLMSDERAREIKLWLPQVFNGHYDPTYGANHYYAFKGKRTS